MELNDTQVACPLVGKEEKDVPEEKLLDGLRPLPPGGPHGIVQLTLGVSMDRISSVS